MSTVDAIVSDVLYGDYLLYPYRPAWVKNRQRATAGLCPQDYCAVHPDEPSVMQFECLIQGTAATSIELTAEFLHLIDRRVQVVSPAVREWPASSPVRLRDVEVVEVDGHHYCAWQEASEHRMPLPSIWLGELFCWPLTMPFTFAARTESEPLRNVGGEVAALLTREQQPLEGRIRVSCACVATGAFRLRVKIVNTTALSSLDIPRNAVMASALLSCHALLRVKDGQFIADDPPERLRRAAAECRNVNAWPLLVSDDDANATLLVSPVALGERSKAAEAQTPRPLRTANRSSASPAVLLP